MIVNLSLDRALVNVLNSSSDRKSVTYMHHDKISTCSNCLNTTIIVICMQGIWDHT